MVSGNMNRLKRYLCPAAIVLLLAGGTIWHASLHRPTGPANGVAVQGDEFLRHPTQATAAAEESQPLAAKEVIDGSRPRPFRVATFNIHGCRGPDGRCDIDRVASFLSGLDFVALNEVHGPGLFETRDQAALLGQRLRMAWLFAPAVRQWYCVESGNGLITALPVAAWHRKPLPRRDDYSYRNAVQVDVVRYGEEAAVEKNGRVGVSNRVIHILLTHINRRWDSDREAQLRAVIAMFLALPEPAMLLGDLNSTAEDPQIRQLTSLPGVIDAVGQILGRGDCERIDWIFIRGLRCLDAGVVDNDASDHPVVWAELE
jgi:endonuclease/exonuclease/phosphatase family metal-dependent hydrolase